METNISSKRNIVKNPNLAGGRPVNYLQSVTEDLNSGLSRNKSRQWPGGGLEPGTSGLQHQRPKPLGHAASDFSRRKI